MRTVPSDAGRALRRSAGRDRMPGMPRGVPGGGNGPAGDLSSAAKRREDFAARLREMRVQAGSPSFRHLAKITNYSSSTLADATSGRRLPTGPVLAALVSACEGDPEPWLEELRQIAAAERSGPAADDADGAGRRRPGWRRLARVAGLASAALVASLASGFALGRGTSPAVSAARPAAELELPGVPIFAGVPAPVPATRVADGTDPQVGHCEGDARPVTSAPVMRRGHQVGLLQLMFSPSCGAGWARIYLSPGEPAMMGAVTIRSADGRSSSFTYPLVNQVDDYTDIIAPGPGGCLGAEGAIYQAGEPIMTASIPCEAPAAG